MTPLIVFIGFLGAGKTTLLRGLLPHLNAAGLKPQVILNDYQNARVDAFTLRDRVESIVPISGNCVCCGSRDEMFDALAAAQLNPNSVMLMEANGTADAAQLIDLLSCDLRAVRYALPWQLAVVDAQRWQRREEYNELETLQLKTATHLYLSHTNNHDAARDDQVMAAVSELNPAATWVSLETFASEVIQLSADASKLPPRVLRSLDHSVHGHGHGHDHAHDQHLATHHFASMELPLPDGWERSKLEAFLQALPPEVIRAKGLVRLAGQRDEYTVFDYLGADRRITLRSYTATPHVASLFLAIGPHLPREAIQAALSRLSPAIEAHPS